MALILSAFMAQSCRDTPVFAKNVSLPGSIGLCFKFGLWGSKWCRIRTCIRLFCILLSSKISWAKVQQADVGFQPGISQKWSKIYTILQHWPEISMRNFAHIEAAILDHILHNNIFPKNQRVILLI